MLIPSEKAKGTHNTDTLVAVTNQSRSDGYEHRENVLMAVQNHPVKVQNLFSKSSDRVEEDIIEHTYVCFGHIIK